MPHRSYVEKGDYLEGDEVFVRATVLSAEADCYQLRVERFPDRIFTFWAPVSEIAKPRDIPRLSPMRRAPAG